MKLDLDDSQASRVEDENIFDKPSEELEKEVRATKEEVFIDESMYDENKNIFDTEDDTNKEEFSESIEQEAKDERQETKENVKTSTVTQSPTVQNIKTSANIQRESDSTGIKKTKLNKFEKRKLKHKRQEELALLRGIPKYFTSFMMETLYIFAVEIILKLLVGNFDFDYTLLRIFLSSAAFGVVLTVLTNNLPNKLRRVILIFFNVLVVFYAWLQIGFLNFMGVFMSVGNAEQGTKAIEYVLDFLSSYAPWVYTIFIPFVLSNVYFGFERYITRDGFEKKIPFKSFAVDTALLVGMTLLAFSYYATLELDFMQNKYQMITNKELFLNPENAVVAIRNFGSTMYLILDVENTLIEGNARTYTPSSKGDGDVTEETDYTRHIDDEAWESLLKMENDVDYKNLNNYFYNRKIVDKNEYTGMFEGKNLVMVMLESIPEALFHEEFKDYFPTFYKLYNEGITGINNYSPINNCGTGESERTSQTSVYSIVTTCTVSTYKENEYPQALLYMLRKNGYYTSSYHNFDDRHYSRNTLEYRFGSMRYYGASDLGISISNQYSEWPSDVDLVEEALPKFINQDKFASYIITVSAHTPYIFDSELGRKHMDLFKDTNYDVATKRFLSKAKETDLALEKLLDELEKAGKLEDTVLVVFGDHYPYALNDKNYQAITPYDITVNNEVDRTPFIIYNSGTEAERITKYTSPMDYAPTLLNLFGVEYDPRLYLGNDVFSEYTDYVLFPDNSWQNTSGFYSSSKGEFMPNEDVEPLSDDEIIALNKEVLGKRDMSGLAIKKDYFSYLFKYFDEYEKLSESDDETNDSDESLDKKKESTKKEQEEKR